MSSDFSVQWAQGMLSCFSWALSCLMEAVDIFLVATCAPQSSGVFAKKYKYEGERSSSVFFSAFWLRSSVVSVLISLITNTMTLS